MVFSVIKSFLLAVGNFVVIDQANPRDTFNERSARKLKIEKILPNSRADEKKR